MIKARACAGDIAAGEAIPARARRPSSGASISTSPRSPTSHAMKRQIHAYRGHDEIAVEGHNIKLGRGGIREIEFFVQTQQLDRRRPASGTARPRDAGDAARSPRAAGSARDARARSRRRLSFPARRRAPAADGRRRADPHAAGRSRRRSSASRALPASRTATHSPKRCSGTCARCSATMRGCSRTRPRPRPRAARCLSAGGRRPRDARPARRDGLPQARWKSSATVRALARRRLSARCAASSRARSSPSWCRCCSTIWRARRIPDARARSPSTGSSAGCTAAARLFSLLRQNPDLVALVALDARHRAAARRHPGALSARRWTR